MSTTTEELQLQIQLLGQEIQNGLTTSNQLLRKLFSELQKIKELASKNGELDENFYKNASLIEKLVYLQQKSPKI